MRDLNQLNSCRIRGQDIIDLWGWDGDGTCGAFVLKSPVDGAAMQVVASSGEGWDHVSVSRRNRCPNWAEMEFVIQKFGKDDEVWMQLHVPASDHVNMHPYTLHWWRPLNAEIPRPPAVLVGVGSTPVRDLAEAKERIKGAGLE